MKELPNELVIEIFEIIDLKETSLFIELSKTNKRFYFIYKRYFEEKVKKKYFEENVKIHIPLQFWFNRNTGLALPLIALEYGEIKININI